ncbi:unnamed protein product [Sphagnum balticum]
MEFAAELLTDEDHRKIVSELLDPGFTRLAVRKEKSEMEIIQYINKSKKKYKYLLGWIEGVNVADNEYLKEMSAEANERHKIFGWQNEHIKIHIMSIRQIVQIPRFNPPGKKKEGFVNVSVPPPVLVPPALETDPYFHLKYTIPSILPPAPLKPVYEENLPKNVEYEGWGSEPVAIVAPPPPPQIHQPPLQPQLLPMMGNSQAYRFNQIRQQLGFGSFSPIVTDEEDNGDKKEDLASNLLNSLGDMGKMTRP